MGATIAYGSKSRVASGNPTVSAAGQHAVLDAILIHGDSASDDVSIEVRTVTDNTILHTFANINCTQELVHFFGLSCGPIGLESTDGLEISATDAGDPAGFTATYLYRENLS